MPKLFTNYNEVEVYGDRNTVWYVVGRTTKCVMRFCRTRDGSAVYTDLVYKGIY